MTTGKRDQRPEGFEGFGPDAIAFLVELAEHNDRAWFQPRKAEYERLLKEPLERLCLALDEAFRQHGVPLSADPARSPFRIYRDVRFSKDKSPYKTAVSASFAWAGDGGGGSGRSHTDKVHASGGYFSFGPGNIFVGGGVWHPEPSWLKAFRDRVMSDYDGFRAVVEAAAFVRAFGSVDDDGESLKRVPAGYPADHPAADILRMKSVTFGRRLNDAEAFSPELPSILADAFAVATPFMRYLASV
jgi:uncharacterized protein (TIGR02453 family)